MVRAIWLSLLVGGVYLASWAVAWSPTDAEPSHAEPLGSAITATSPPRDANAILGRGDKTQAETLKVLAHNLANAGTTGFKARYVAAEAVDLGEGGGTRHTARTDFRQGDLIDTDQPLDWAIFGKGFFLLSGEDGTQVFTRRGDFALNVNSNIVLRVDGREFLLDPPITIPIDALSVHINHEGIVEVEQPGQCERSQVGQTQLASFVNVDGLRDLGGGLFAATEISGSVAYESPDTNGAGKIRQGRLEASNVDVEATIEQYRGALDQLGRVRAVMNQRPMH